MLHIIKIHRQLHASLLADHRVDPITKQLLKVGDEVCVCAICKTVYLKDVWITTLKGECCGQKKTLPKIPGSDYSAFEKRKNSNLKPIHITFSSDPNFAIRNRPITLFWEVKNARLVELFEDDKLFEEVPSSGKKRMYPSKTSKYTIKASNALENCESNLVIHTVEVPKLSQITLPEAPQVPIDTLLKVFNTNGLLKSNISSWNKGPIHNLLRERSYPLTHKISSFPLFRSIDKKNLLHLLSKIRRIKNLFPFIQNILKTKKA